jgi:hypothetical protein
MVFLFGITKFLIVLYVPPDLGFFRRKAVLDVAENASGISEAA